MSLGVRLKQARLKKKLTQEELAEIVGIKQQAVQRIEASKVKSTSYVVQLAQALDVTPEWLALGGEPLAGSTNDFPASSMHGAHPAPLLQWHQVDSITNTCFTLQIKDVSMIASAYGEPSFLKDDYLLIDPAVEAKVGDFVIVKLPESSQMTFRQLIKKDNTLQLKALNTQYNTIALTNSMKMCGVVIQRYSYFTH
jgi:SOS-response transcriptional repressor LexA